MKDKFQPLQPREFQYVDARPKDQGGRVLEEHKTHNELMAEINRLRGELEKFNRTGRDFKDAERYRWLRDIGCATYRTLQGQWRRNAAQCDALVDSAMRSNHEVV